MLHLLDLRQTLRAKQEQVCDLSFALHRCAIIAVSLLDALAVFEDPCAGFAASWD